MTCDGICKAVRSVYWVFLHNCPTNMCVYILWKGIDFVDVTFRAYGHTGLGCVQTMTHLGSIGSCHKHTFGLT